MQRALTIVFGLIFLASAVAKLVTIQEFELYVFSFGIVKYDLASLASRLLIILEAGTGLWFLSGWKIPAAKVLAGLELLAFSAFLVWRIVLKDSGSCHCFGNLVEMNPWQSLIKNAVLAVLLVFSSSSLFPRPVPLILFAGTVAFSITVFAVYPPDFYYRWVVDGPHYVNTSKWEELSEKDGVEGKKIICFFSTQCEHCVHCAKKLSSMLDREHVASDNVLIYFMETSDSTTTEVPDFLQKNMNGADYPFLLLDPLVFIPITNGVMPVILFVDGTTVLQEFDSQTISDDSINNFSR